MEMGVNSLKITDGTKTKN